MLLHNLWISNIKYHNVFQTYHEINLLEIHLFHPVLILLVHHHHHHHSLLFSYFSPPYKSYLGDCMHPPFGWCHLSGEHHCISSGVLHRHVPCVFLLLQLKANKKYKNVPVYRMTQINPKLGHFCYAVTFSLFSNHPLFICLSSKLRFWMELAIVLNVCHDLSNSLSKWILEINRLPK